MEWINNWWFLILSIVVAPLIAATVQRQREPIMENGLISRYVYRKFSMPAYVITFLILFTLLFLTKSGSDISVYVSFYENWTFHDLSDFKFEPGYKLLCIFLHKVIKNPYIGIGIIKFLGLFLVFKAIYILRDQINIGVAVFAYTTLLYIYSFSLLRMMIAVGIVFLAFSYEVIGKRKRCLFLLCLAIFFHYSSSIVLFAYIIYRIIGRKMSFIKTALLTIAMTVAFLSIGVLVNYAIMHFSIFSKYSAYKLGEVSRGSGLMQLIWFFPVLYILIRIYRKQYIDKFYILCAVCGVMTLFCGSLGYRFPVFSRSTYYFYFFFVAYAASLQLNLASRFQLVIGGRKINSLTLLILLYLIVKVIFDITYIHILRSIGLLEYLFFWQ